MQPTIAALGNLPVDDRLRDLAQEFGWSLVRIAAFRQLQERTEGCDVIAILYEPRAVAESWQEALRSLREALPEALPIVCHRFSESLPWPELAAAGAFQELWVPFNLREVRQTWGFVQAARLARDRGAPSKGARKSIAAKRVVA